MSARHREIAFSCDRALNQAVDAATATPCPPILAQALRYAVFPGGARLRPRLAMIVARACGMAHPELAAAGAAAIELLHSASLVHDDLPLFDDADMRRGRPSVHRAFSAPIALLVGDALIVQAFESLARAPGPAEVVLAMTRALASSVGSPRGIVAGQAWESEPEPDVRQYHRAKTGSLFAGAVAIGAIAGGGDPSAWIPLGFRIGEAYQVADDLGDVLASPQAIGKPTGRDAALGRPNVVADLGVVGAKRRLEALVHNAEDDIPACPLRAEIAGDLRAMFAAA